MHHVRSILLTQTGSIGKGEGGRGEVRAKAHKRLTARLIGQLAAGYSPFLSAARHEAEERAGPH